MLLFFKVMPCIDSSARWKFRPRKSRMATTLFDVWKWCYRSPSRVMLPGLHGQQGMRLEREQRKLPVWVPHVSVGATGDGALSERYAPE